MIQSNANINYKEKTQGVFFHFLSWKGHCKQFSFCLSIAAIVTDRH